MSPSTTLATSQHWKHVIERLDNTDLLPHRLSVDALIFLARALEMNRCGALYANEITAVRDLLVCWIERLLVAQGLARLRPFRRRAKVLLPLLTDELERWIHKALLSRQIGYPLTQTHMGGLFQEAFAEVERPVSNARLGTLAT